MASDTAAEAFQICVRLVGHARTRVVHDTPIPIGAEEIEAESETRRTPSPVASWLAQDPLQKPRSHSPRSFPSVLRVERKGHLKIPSPTPVSHPRHAVVPPPPSRSWLPARACASISPPALAFTGTLGRCGRPRGQMESGSRTRDTVSRPTWHVALITSRVYK